MFGDLRQHGAEIEFRVQPVEFGLPDLLYQFEC
jgi:hypothetical protein